MNQQMLDRQKTQAIGIMDAAEDINSYRLYGVSYDYARSQTVQSVKQIADDFADDEQHHATALLHQEHTSLAPGQRNVLQRHVERLEQQANSCNLSHPHHTQKLPVVEQRNGNGQQQDDGTDDGPHQQKIHLQLTADDQIAFFSL